MFLDQRDPMCTFFRIMVHKQLFNYTALVEEQMKQNIYASRMAYPMNIVEELKHKGNMDEDETVKVNSSCNKDLSGKFKIILFTSGFGSGVERVFLKDVIQFGGRNTICEYARPVSMESWTGTKDSSFKSYCRTTTIFLLACLYVTCHER